MVQSTNALKNFNPGGKEKGTAGNPVKLPGAKLGGSGRTTPGAHQPGGPDKTTSGGMTTGAPVYQTINVNYNGTKPSPEEHQAAMIRLSAAIGVA